MLWNEDILLWGSGYDDGDDSESDDKKDETDEKEGEGDEKDNKGEGSPSGDDNEPDSDDIDDKGDEDDDSDSDEDDEDSEGDNDEDDSDGDDQDDEDGEDLEVDNLPAVDLSTITGDIDDEAIDRRLESFGIDPTKATAGERKMAKSALHSQRKMTQATTEASDTRKELQGLRDEIESLKSNKGDQSSSDKDKGKGKTDTSTEDTELTEADAFKLWDEGKTKEAQALLRKIRNKELQGVRDEFKGELSKIKEEQANELKTKQAEETRQNNLNVTMGYMKKTLADALRAKGNDRRATKVESSNYQLTESEQMSVYERTKRVYTHAVQLFNLGDTDKVTQRHLELAEIDINPNGYKDSIKRKERAAIKTARQKAKGDKSISFAKRKGRSEKQKGSGKMKIVEGKKSGYYADRASEMTTSEIDKMLDELGV
jgi:hypothetical protein